MALGPGASGWDAPCGTFKLWGSGFPEGPWEVLGLGTGSGSGAGEAGAGKADARALLRAGGEGGPYKALRAYEALQGLIRL